jgi:glutathione S-transferase
MKLYDFKMAPNPRRVRIFLAEKGVEMEIIPVDLSQKEQMNEPFVAVNPRRAVPALVLDDGRVLTESGAICRYIEELHPEPPLLGRDTVDRAVVEMWHRRVELEGLQAVAEGVRNSSDFFKGRAISGPVDFPQIPELAERGRKRTALFKEMLDEQLADNEFVAGVHYTIADIAALVACDFAKVLKMRVDDDTPNLKRWYDAVSARPSAAA